MRAATRPAFPAPQVKEDSKESIVGAAAGTVVGISLLVGTSLWLAGLIAVYNDLIDRSLPWWSWAAFSGLFHIVRSVMFPRR